MSKKAKQILAIVALVAITFGIIMVLDFRDSGGGVYSEDIFAMDTMMTLTVYKTEEMDISPDDLLKEMSDKVYDLENKLSVTKADSDIGKINSANGEAVEISADTHKLLRIAKDIARETQGSFDPTVYPIVKLWGFTTGNYKIPTEKEIKRNLSLVDYNALYVFKEYANGITESEDAYDDNTPPGTEDGTVEMYDSQGGVVDKNDAKMCALISKYRSIDLGACAKGYLSDVLCDMIKKHKATGIVSLGGNVQSVGVKPDGEEFNVGIADPKHSSSVYKTINSKDEAVVTSGNYERYFEEKGRRYHHIIDPSTGLPVDNGLVSVTVVGPKGVYCDAYATAFFVMGEKKTREFLKDHDEYRAAFIYEDGHDSGFDTLE